MSRFSSPMKIQSAILAFIFYFGNLAAQHITTHSGGQVNTTAVANRIATQLPAAPDLANAWFLVEKLPTQTVGGNAIRARVYSINNLDQVMGINYIGGTTPTIWSASGAHPSGASDYTQELSSAKKLNDFARFVANKTGPSAQGGVFTFSELGGVVLEQTMPGITLHGINNYGWMLAVEPEQPGYSYNFKSYYGRHFILKGTGEVNIAVPRDAENGAYLEGINIAGQVVGGASPQYGYVGARGFFAEADGKFRWLTSNNNFDEAYGVNDSGQIVGTTSLPDYSSVPALWENGRGAGIESLPTVRLAGGFENAWANAINKWGQIVGRTRAGIALWLNKRQLDFTGRLINPENLKLISLLDINDRGVMLGEQNYTQGGITYSDNFILRPIWPQLAVDANRDGEIRFRTNGTMGSEDNSDVTSADKPYRFWVNDDDDGDQSRGEEEFINDVRDHEFNRLFGVRSRRDLEDFARMHIYFGGLQEAIVAGRIKVGLKWKEGYTDSPAINVYLSADATGSDSYITDATGTAALAQITGDYKNAIKDTDNRVTVDTSGTFIFRPEFWSGLNANNPRHFLLFEVESIGSGQLVIVLLGQNGNLLGECPGVWFDLKNIKSMYERAVVTTGGPRSQNGTDYTISIPSDFTGPDANNIPRPTMGWEPNPLGFAFNPDPAETKTYIIYVHGWRWSPEKAINRTETVFKRLWHVGYKGRLAALRWPTFYGGPDDDDSSIWPTPPGLFTYNNSEYRAWKSGDSLKQYVNNLPGDYARSVVAHSMGNFVTSEALRNGMAVLNYAMLNSAVSASCYDETVSLRQPEWYYITPNTDSDPGTRSLAYVGRFGTLNANVINFYLPNDSATLNGWNLWNSRWKPEWYQPENVGYEYHSNWEPGDRLRIKFALSVPRNLIDPHESMAYACQSLTYTVGAEHRTAGSIDDRVNMDALFQFGNEHGAQWDRRIQQDGVRDFYRRLLLKLDISIP